MESILSIPSIIWKSGSQGGPQHELGGMTGMIVLCCTSSPKSGHYTVFSGLVVNCEIPVYTVSLRWDRFTTEGKEPNGTDAPEKAVRCGV